MDAETEATGAIPNANLASFQESVGPILSKSCLACHGPEKSEGRLRIDQLNPDLLTGPDVERWRGIYKVLSNSEMPPEDEPDYALADADRGNMVDWLSEELNKASLVRRNSKEHSSFRRMTKYEYNYALQDLLGLPYPLANKLPPETASEDGFKNSSDLLQMSAMQFETYREIGLKALKRATVSGERPQAVTYIISMQEEMEKVTARQDDKHSTRLKKTIATTGISSICSINRPARHSILRLERRCLKPRLCRANAGRFARGVGPAPIQRVETGSGSLSSR